MQLIKRIRTSSSKLNIRISAKISHRNRQKGVNVLPDLPLEVWQIIFAFATFVAPDIFYGRKWLLNPPSDDNTPIHLNTRYQLALVCKEWQAASLRFLYASIFLSDWDHVQFVLHALEISRERDDEVPLGWFTRDLVIPCNVLDETRNQTLVARILRCLPNLRYLRLSTTKPSLTFVENHVIDVLCTSCLGLEVLETTEYVAILPYGAWPVIFDSLKSLHSFTTTFIQPRFASDVDTLTSTAASSSLTYLHLHIFPSTDVANTDLSVPIPQLPALQTWVYDVDVTDDAEFHRNVMKPTLVAYRTQLSTIILCCDFYYGHHVQTIFSLVNLHCPCLETLMLVPTRQPQNACWELPNDSLTLPGSVTLLGVCASKCGAALSGGQLRGLFRVLQCMSAVSLVAVRLTSWRNVKDLMGLNQASEYARQYGRHVLAKQGWTLEDPDGRALW